MPEKYVFTDIDGTLRHSAAGIPESALKALRKARKNGHRLIICTGRTRNMLPDDIPLEMFDGIIAGGGCYLEYKGSVLRNITLPKDIIGRFIRFFRAENIPFSLESSGRIYMSVGIEQLIAEKTDFSSGDNDIFGCISSIGEYENSPEPVSRIHFCMEREQYDKDRLPVSEEIKLIPLMISPDGYVHAEIISRGCDKGDGMRLFCEYTYIHPEDTVAVGDSMNDAAMFDFAGLSICMGNAPEELKKRADIVSRDILSDGLYFGFYKAGLL